MIRLIYKVALGVVLSGCSLTTHRHAPPNSDYFFNQNETIIINPLPNVEKLDPVVPMPVQIIHGNKHIKPECGLYEPLKIPKPIKIDLNSLAGKTNLEINAIVLKNNKDMFTTLVDFGIRQEKHYANYLKRCAVK